MADQLKTVARIGDPHGVILDDSILRSAQLQNGDEVSVEVTDSGEITIRRVKPGDQDDAIKELIDKTLTDYANTMQRLA